MERMIYYSYTPGSKEVVNAKDEAEGGAERGSTNSEISTSPKLDQT